ncbi:MAG: S8 family serine peptidase [Candidatus Cloacimonadales bacterium]|nr:S8 family serine peptidase [Candidatus Cloacimonadota bacterium]MDX9976856.1 S8 family serine peptidase [Candidatus Cloacimonadales bacterium]
MKKICLFTLIVFSFILLGAAEYVPNELIIKTNKSQKVQNKQFENQRLSKLFKSKNAVSVQAVSMKNDNQYYLVRFAEDTDLSQVKAELSTSKDLSYTQYNYLNKLHRVPNDPMYNSQKHVLEMIKLPYAWAQTVGSEQVLVGVVDSGIDFDHPDLQNNIYKNNAEIPNNGIDDDGNGYIDDYQGWDFVDAPNMDGIGDYLDRDNDACDENYHGTHVSGIIGADTDNNIGIAGTAWNVKILPIRAGFRTEDGSGYLQDNDAAAGIIYAADMGCNIINLSWGDENYSPIIEDACNYAINKGSIIVASAGNTPGPTLSYPARLNNVIAVGAVNDAQQLASFTSYGSDLDIVAPGQSILSAYGPANPYGEMSGTSMAAPFVTGAIALLLAENPNLSYHDVRARLHASAKDLGDKGFDNKFGAGLLDVEKLLKLPSAHSIIIDSPKDRAYLNSSFDLFGTIDSPNFFRYSLMYSNKKNPSSTDWKDIYTHQNTPNFIYYLKHNELLGHFYLPNIFTDGEYRIRVRIEDKNGQTFDSFKTIFIDRALPIYKNNSLFVQKRWNNEKLNYVATFAFNKLVQVNLRGQLFDDVNTAISEEFIISSTLPDSIFSMRIPEHIGRGKLSVMLEAEDFAGNRFATDWMHNIADIKEEEVNTDNFAEQEIGVGLTFARNSFDFNNNNINEIIGMEISTALNGIVRAYEYQNGEFVTKFTFSEQFNPLYLGSTQSGRTNLLGLNAEKLDVYEGFVGQLNYPDLSTWSLNNVSGAILFDFTNSGKDQLIIARNLADQTALELYNREANQFVKFNTIFNTAPTTQRRMFIPKIIGGNLDNDEYPDLLLSDVAGNVMIYEWINNAPVRSWITSIPVLNAYFMEIGDFTGDGKNEFLVGGYVKTDNFDKSYWYFALFANYESSEGSDNRYQMLSEISFSNVTKGQSSTTSADIDGDGKTEAILAIPPNIYVVKYEDGELKPIWMTKGDKTFQTIALEEAKDGVSGFFFNRQEGDQLKTYFVQKEEPFAGPNTPKQLRAKVLDQESVKLSWQNDSSDTVNLYRKLGQHGEIEMVSSVSATEYLDTGLLADSTYFYAVTAVSQDYEINESHFSLWVSVTMGAQAVLEDAKMINNSLLILKYNSPLSLASLNRANFIASISNSDIYPSSISCMAGDKWVLLHFNNGINTDSDFQLSVQGLMTATGTEIDAQDIRISYQIDTIPPYIRSVNLHDKDKIELIFSELLDPISINNYQYDFSIESPFSHLKVKVTEATLIDSIITLGLSQELINTIKPYWVRVNNVYDLAGNCINNNDSRHSLYLTEITNLTYMETYPNPLRLKDMKEVIFTNLPADKSGEIRIFNLAGELIYKHKLNNCTEFAWDGKNNHQQIVSSGIYTYLVKMGNDFKKGKLVLIK